MDNWVGSGRVVRWLLAGTAAVLILLLAASVAVIQFPSIDQPSKADAIIVLGQPDAYNMPAARKLIDEGVSNQLVISIPFGAPDECGQPPVGVDVFCFIPDPSTTRGEAQEIGRLAREHGWSNVAVVTWPTHISRSRALIERCYGGTLQMVDYDDQMSFATRMQENVYQSGAFLKAMIDTGC